MTPNELAQKAAEEVFRTIERERTLIKANVAEAIERVLLTHQVTPVAYVPAQPQPLLLDGATTWWPSSGSVTISGYSGSTTGGTCGND